MFYTDSPRLDDDGRARVDELELKPEIQEKVEQLWDQVTSESIGELTDFVGYKADFLRLFGFGVDGVDYDADVNPAVEIENML